MLDTTENPVMQLHSWKHSRRALGVCVAGAARYPGSVLIKTGDNRSSVNIMFQFYAAEGHSQVFTLQRGVTSIRSH